MPEESQPEINSVCQTFYHTRQPLYTFTDMSIFISHCVVNALLNRLLHKHLARVDMSLTVFKMHLSHRMFCIWHRQDLNGSGTRVLCSMQCVRCLVFETYVGLLSMCVHYKKSTQTAPTTAERWIFTACRHCSYLVLLREVERRSDWRKVWKRLPIERCGDVPTPNPNLRID